MCRLEVGTEQDLMEEDLQQEEKELEKHILKPPAAMQDLANACKKENWPDSSIEQLNSILYTCYRKGHDGIIKVKGNPAEWRSYSSFAKDGKQW